MLNARPGCRCSDWHAFWGAQANWGCRVWLFDGLVFAEVQELICKGGGVRMQSDYISVQEQTRSYTCDMV